MKNTFLKYVAVFVAGFLIGRLTDCSAPSGCNPFIDSIKVTLPVSRTNSDIGIIPEIKGKVDSQVSVKKYGRIPRKTEKPDSATIVKPVLDLTEEDRIPNGATLLDLCPPITLDTVVWIGDSLAIRVRTTADALSGSFSNTLAQLVYYQTKATGTVSTAKPLGSLIKLELTFGGGVAYEVLATKRVKFFLELESKIVNFVFRLKPEFVLGDNSTFLWLESKITF